MSLLFARPPNTTAALKYLIQQHKRSLRGCLGGGGLSSPPTPKRRSTCIVKMYAKCTSFLFLCCAEPWNCEFKLKLSRDLFLICNSHLLCIRAGRSVLTNFLAYTYRAYCILVYVKLKLLSPPATAEQQLHRSCNEGLTELKRRSLISLFSL